MALLLLLLVVIIMAFKLMKDLMLNRFQMWDSKSEMCAVSHITE
jgi:hypothetical protein